MGKRGDEGEREKRDGGERERGDEREGGRGREGKSDRGDGGKVWGREMGVTEIKKKDLSNIPSRP